MKSSSLSKQSPYSTQPLFYRLQISSHDRSSKGQITQINYQNEYFRTKNPNIATITLDLGAGEAKFRANNDWKFNWGTTGYPNKKGTTSGSNISVPAGTYTVTFNVNTGDYSFK